MEIEKNGIYTTREVAELLKISLPTVKRLLKENKLPSTRIGRQHRFWGKDLLEILSQRKDLRMDEKPRIVRKIEAKPPVTFVSPPSPPQSHGLSSVEQRQRQYMLGKKLSRNILDEEGNIIFQEGSVVTDDIIMTAKKNKKIMELFTSIQHGQI